MTLWISLPSSALSSNTSTKILSEGERGAAHIDRELILTVLAGATTDHEGAGHFIVPLVDAVAHDGFEARRDTRNEDWVADDIHDSRLVNANRHRDSFGSSTKWVWRP